uniref:protein O-GlcNAc transferase n=1 Tax=Phaeomonas parva TaxID=124430 RepID=A0A6U4E2X8_9STRA|mmetsp:Transcript_1911/g.5618  ORF Transcript_1911/g.5618 Transcript_1911/m.5618 type:complete len:851 (+) Transcript_1911:660-3212(+)
MVLGQFPEAIETYKMALVLKPTLVDAHSNLGNLFKVQGNLEEAKRCYLEAIRIQPGFAIAWSNLAGIFKEEGQLTTAVAYYREAIRLCPTFADAHSNLGNALKEQGLVLEAMECYRASIKLRPDFAIAHGNLASCYYDLGQLDVAVRTFRYAIQLEPNFPDAYNNLGNAQRDLGRIDEAITSYRTALRLRPDHPHAYNNLGNAMTDKGFVKEAIHCYVTAIRLMPRFAAAHSNLGSILKEQGKLEQSLAHYHEAIVIDPLFADAYSNMGNAYKEMNRLEDAIRCYTTAIKIKPGFADAYSNLASAYKDGGRVEEAIVCYQQALKLNPASPDAFANLVHSLVFVCNWQTRDADFEQLRKLLTMQFDMPNQLPSVQPFHTLVYPLTCAEMLEIAKRHAARAAQAVQLLEMRPFRRRPPKKGVERIKIGYVSSDFGNHPLSHLMHNVFAMHDPSRFEVHLYALSNHDGSAWRTDIEQTPEHFHNLTLLDTGAAANLIHQHGIHILVNLNGYTKGARNEIFALHPASLQVSYLGFCGTLGADYIEYMIADERVVPPEERQHYSEKLIYMPHSYFVNDHKQSARYVLPPSPEDEEMAEAQQGSGESRVAALATLSTRGQYGVRDDAFVFGNFNQLYKLDPETFATWCNVLKRVPNSILWLLRFPPASEKNIRAEARKNGVREDQIHFTDVSPKEEHIKRGHLVDLFLDTPCCNAHTTGCDILWSGTPMLTLPGKKMATRVAQSLLHAAGPGFTEALVVGSLSEYEERAVELAMDTEKLFQLRLKLEDGRDESPLFDTQRWVRNMERGLEEIWAVHCAEQPPKDVRVVDVLDVEAAGAGDAAGGADGSNNSNSSSS